jgi:hypothetical protein
MAIALTPLVTVLRVQFILQMIVLAFIGDGKWIEERAIAIFHSWKIIANTKSLKTDVHL